MPYLRSFRAIVNRRVESVAQIHKLIKENLPPGLGIERRVDFVDRDADALGALFRRDDAPRVDNALARQLAGVFAVEGGS